MTRTVARTVAEPSHETAAKGVVRRLGGLKAPTKPSQQPTPVAGTVALTVANYREPSRGTVA